MSFLECLDDPLQRQMYDYWQKKRAGRRMPARRDIDPVDIPRLLPNILISEVVPGPTGVRYRYRLAGTAIARAFARDPTGRFADELTSGAYRDFILGLHRTVCEEGRALFSESRYLGKPELLTVAKRLLLPVSDNDDQVNQIISLLVFRFGSKQPASIALDRTEGTTSHTKPILAEM
jgi:hypothetical protein